MRKIILSGYMGSGKSTIANLLHKLTGIQTIDLDKYIEQKSNLSISEIFKQKGEVLFRKLEHEALKELIDSQQEFILSLGGGTPCYSNNLGLLESADIMTIYLKASIATLCQRLAAGIAERPLLAGKSAGEMREFIAKHLFERNPYYNQARHIIETDNKTPPQVADEILKILA